MEERGRTLEDTTNPRPPNQGVQDTAHISDGGKKTD
jgi:hypothetical protein